MIEGRFGHLRIVAVVGAGRQVVQQGGILRAVNGNGGKMALRQGVSALVHIKQAQLIACRQMAGIEFQRQLQPLLGQLKLGAILGNADQVIGEAVEKLQVRIGDIKLECTTEQALRLIQILVPKGLLPFLDQG